MFPRVIRLLVVAAVVMSACTPADPPAGAQATTTTTAETTSTTTTSTSTSTTSTTTTTTTTVPVFALRGVVTTPDGKPLGSARVVAGTAEAVTAEDGTFDLGTLPAGPVNVSRPAWLPQEFDWDGSQDSVIVLEPRIVRALRVSRYTMSEGMLPDTLLLAADSAVNALVFDTKDETGSVLYETGVEYAHQIGAVDPIYDPVEAIAAAKEAGLYTITRIVSFEDDIRVDADRDSKLAGDWVNVADPDNWTYLLDLGVEACELGFDEIQYDYIRFPAGRTAAVARASHPTTQEERVAAVTGFLTEARSLLHPMGCAISADIFAIVVSSPDDQGIGQRPEELSFVVDAISPMIYPSHYSDGWLGFASPNDHPGPVVARALDDGIPRLEGTALMRPWLQAFYYSPSQILTEIDEAEKRGVGWILWNAGGNYAASALPEEPEVSETVEP